VHCNFNNIDELTDKTLVALAAHCPRLEFLDLQHIHGITWAGIAALGRIEMKGGCIVHGCPSVHTVRVTECQVSEKQIRTLAANLPFGKSTGNRRGISAVPANHRAQNAYIWERHTVEVAATYLQVSWDCIRWVLTYASVGY
jgi:hypothetical protein